MVPSEFVTIEDNPQSTIDLVKQNYKAVTFEFIYEVFLSRESNPVGLV